MGQFADIRPFNDSEVAPAVARLLADRELLSAVSNLKLGPWHRYVSALIYPLVRRRLAKELAGVCDVDSFQMLVKRYLEQMVEDSVTQFSVSGLDQLDPNKPYLFMSNHRDIALDPAFVNYALYQNGGDTVRIAIGDNLLTKPFVSDLMRLNKSFIVKRSAKGPRQVLAAYKLLSGYIRHSIQQDHSSIWIAQREGRAKDGIDKTEPAIIKMLSIAQDRKKEDFSDYIAGLNIVPVTISYEWDPCDGAKAQELYQKETHGSYEKDEHEDVASIGLGISGQKGAVHVSFGTPLSGEFEGPEAVAAEVDRQVIENYVLHPSNFLAYDMLHGQCPGGVHGPDAKPFVAGDFKAEQQHLAQRIAALPSEHRDYALAIYANSLASKLAQC